MHFFSRATWVKVIFIEGFFDAMHPFFPSRLKDARFVSFEALCKSPQNQKAGPCRKITGNHMHVSEFLMPDKKFNKTCRVTSSRGI